jgi:predicted nucleic acid-binding Zn ribbon protein
MKKISEVIDKLIKTNPKLEKLGIFSIKTAWEEVVGDLIASKAKVEDFRNGILTVVCMDPMWSSEIHFRKKKILQEINKILSNEKVRDIIIHTR